MKLNPTVAGLLKRAGAYLVRHRKHLVFRLPNGSTFVASSTPSDVNAHHNQIRDLKKIGIVGETREYASDWLKKQKPNKPGRHGADKVQYEPFNSSLAAGLSKVGLVESLLREQLLAKTKEADELQLDCRLLLDAVGDYQKKIANHEESIALLKQQRQNCWYCRVRDWWSQ